ncbi:hypothetical protein VZT92_004356 [Zoarces viviparus]|uniref:Uncharacterized protein n=1 Tax=Zoarces viviparus TaxID=48416 RepID=A0AAW1FYN9_ZOAVI
MIRHLLHAAHVTARSSSADESAGFGLAAPARSLSDRGACDEDIATMVKDKAEERTLQYQQTLVSFG